MINLKYLKESQVTLTNEHSQAVINVHRLEGALIFTQQLIELLEKKSTEKKDVTR